MYSRLVRVFLIRIDFDEPHCKSNLGWFHSVPLSPCAAACLSILSKHTKLYLAPYSFPPPQKKWGKGLEGFVGESNHQDLSYLLYGFKPWKLATQGAALIIINHQLGAAALPVFYSDQMQRRLKSWVGKDVIRGQIKGFAPHRFGTMNTEQILFIIIRAIISLPTSGGGMVTSLYCGEKYGAEVELNIGEGSSFVGVKVMMIIYHSLVRCLVSDLTHLRLRSSPC